MPATAGALLGLPLNAAVSIAVESVRASSAASQSAILTIESWRSSFAIVTAPVTFLAVSATWVLVGASALALAVGWRLERRLAPLPLLAGGFALIFGSLTLIFHDPTLLKLKLTIQNTLLAMVLLGSLPFRKYPFRYLLESAFRLTEAGWRGLTLRYGLFFAAVAIVNEVIWRTQSDDVWVSFRGGLWLASAGFGIWQVVYIMKHMIRDEPEDAPGSTTPDPDR